MAGAFFSPPNASSGPRGLGQIEGNARDFSPQISFLPKRTAIT